MEKIRSEQIKMKISKIADEVNTKVRNGIRWAMDNPEITIAGIAATAALIRSTRSIVVSHRVVRERRRIDYTFYDPSSGFHWDLRRKPNNADRAEIIRRKKLGQDMYTILTEMRLIK